MKMLVDESKKDKKKEFAAATFKTSRLINGHSIENVAAGVEDVKISHRFGMVNKGSYEFLGLDQATMRMVACHNIDNKCQCYEGYCAIVSFRPFADQCIVSGV